MQLTDRPNAIIGEDSGQRVAQITWTDQGRDRVIDHTWVSPALRGQGVALTLVERAVARARSEGKRVVPACSYVAATLAMRPDLASA